MLELLRDFTLKALGHLLPFAVAWFYKPEKIAADVKFRVRGDGDGVTYEGGELPKVRIWFLVSNLSPFKVEIDRMVIQLSFGSVIEEIAHIRKHEVGPSKEVEFLVETTLNSAQVAFIQKNLPQRLETKLYVAAFLNTKLHNFESVVHVSTSNVRMVNYAL